MTTLTYNPMNVAFFPAAPRFRTSFTQARAALPDLPSDETTLALGAKILAGLAAASVPFSALFALFLYG